MGFFRFTIPNRGFAALVMSGLGLSGVASAAPHAVQVPAKWKELLTTGRSLEVATDPSFTTPFFSVEGDPRRKVNDFDKDPALKFPVVDDNQVLFWRFRDRESRLRQHPGLTVVVPAAGAVWINLGSDARPTSRWEIFANEIESGFSKRTRPEKTFLVSGTSVLLMARERPWVYRVVPAFDDVLVKKTDAQFAGLLVARASASRGDGAASIWKLGQVLFPPNATIDPAVSELDQSPEPVVTAWNGGADAGREEFVGPLGSVIDPRDPTRESVSSVRLFGKYLNEDLVIKRNLEFDVSGAKSIGGAIRIEDVGFYPASILVDFEWHGIQAEYQGAAADEPPTVIKHVFGGLMVGYDFGRFVPALAQNNVAIHMGPQVSLISVPVTRDFEPMGFVGLRVQPQLIRFGATWYASLQSSRRNDGTVNHVAAGYMNCQFLEICLSGEAYQRKLEIQSGSNETRLAELGIALGLGKKL